jgi:hypothetical protein
MLEDAIEQGVGEGRGDRERAPAQLGVPADDRGNTECEWV